MISEPSWELSFWRVTAGLLAIVLALLLAWAVLAAVALAFWTACTGLYGLL